MKNTLLISGGKGKVFQILTERKCSGYDKAFQAAWKLGRIKFLADLFSSS